MRLYAPPITDINQITTRNHAELNLLSANDHQQYALLSAVNTFLAAADWGANKLTSTYVPLAAADLVNKLYADAATSKKIDITYTPVAFTTSTAENTLYTGTIAANKLGTTNAVRYRFYFSGIHWFNTETFTIRFKLGGTTILSFTVGGTQTETISGVIECVVIASGATNTQRVISQMNIGQASYVGNGHLQPEYFSGFAVNTSAVDSTASIAVLLTSQLSTSGGGESITLDSMTAEWIS